MLRGGGASCRPAGGAGAPRGCGAGAARGRGAGRAGGAAPRSGGRRGSRAGGAAASGGDGGPGEGEGGPPGGGAGGVKAFQQPLERAAEVFREGLEAGIDRDELLAAMFGKEDPDGLSGAEAEYRDKIIAKLEEIVREQSADVEKGVALYESAQRQYERGSYRRTLELAEEALKNLRGGSLEGGRVLIFKAMALDALGRETEAAEVYKSLEETHPLTTIRKQAEELLYILEAPRLKIGADERVSIPDMSNFEKNDPKRRRGRAPVRRQAAPGGKKEKELNWQDKFAKEYKVPLPEQLKNKYVQVMTVVLVVGVAFWSATVVGK